jgi:hypothetical protein
MPIKKNSQHPLNRAQKAARAKDVDTYFWAMLEATTMELKLRDSVQMVDQQIFGRLISEVSRRNPPPPRKDTAADLADWLELGNQDAPSVPAEPPESPLEETVAIEAIAS